MVLNPLPLPNDIGIQPEVLTNMVDQLVHSDDVQPGRKVFREIIKPDYPSNMVNFINYHQNLFVLTIILFQSSYVGRYRLSFHVAGINLYRANEGIFMRNNSRSLIFYRSTHG